MSSWLANKRSIEEIDLTLSSPEPDPRPQHQPNPPNLPSQPTRLDIERRRTSNSTKARPANPPRPQVNPQHLAMIIQTSDIQAIQSVLLNLCKMSPALSGAVVRGLAPHSTFARGLVKKHCAQAPRPSVKAERADVPARNQAPTRFRSLSPAASDGSSSTRLPERLPAPSTPTHLPGKLPISLERKPSSNSLKPPNSDRTFSGNISTGTSSSSRNAYTGGLAQSSARRPDKRLADKECQNCHRPFLDGSSANCFYHPGRKQMTEDVTGRRVAQYTCCRGDEWDAPCTIGKHIAPTASAFDSLKRPLPFNDPSPFISRPRKSPKLR